MPRCCIGTGSAASGRLSAVMAIPAREFLKDSIEDRDGSSRGGLGRGRVSWNDPPIGRADFGNARIQGR